MSNEFTGDQVAALHDIRDLLDHVLKTEKKAYEAAGCPKNHIYAKAMRVEEWLKS